MYQIVPMTHEEKVEMYSKESKEKLIEMLIACNNALDSVTPHVTYETKTACLCPVCNGRGIMTAAFYGDTSTGGAMYIQCKSCEGKGVIIV